MKNFLLLLIVSTFFLEGCVGAWVLREESTATTYAESQISSDKNKDKPISNLHHKLPTKQSIQKEFGNPQEVETIGNKEIWHYDKELGWSGIVPILVVVPLPLIFPSNRETVFEFEGNKALLKRDFYTKEKIHGCGIFALHTISFGCHSL
jgi:hypothetical protein